MDKSRIEYIVNSYKYNKKIRPPNKNIAKRLSKQFPRKNMQTHN